MKAGTTIGGRSCYSAFVDSPDKEVISNEKWQFLVIGKVAWGQPSPISCVQMARVRFTFYSSGKLKEIHVENYGDEDGGNAELYDEVHRQEGGG